VCATQARTTRPALPAAQVSHTKPSGPAPSLRLAQPLPQPLPLQPDACVTAMQANPATHWRQVATGRARYAVRTTTTSAGPSARNAAPRARGRPTITAATPRRPACRTVALPTPTLAVSRFLPARFLKVAITVDCHTTLAEQTFMRPTLCAGRCANDVKVLKPAGS